MTPAEHALQVARVRAAELLAITRADRHGTYPHRRAPRPRAVPPRAAQPDPTRR